jgi:hypothetical protein
LQEVLFFKKFPVLFPVSREFTPQTGSLATVSSARHSRDSRLLAAHAETLQIRDVCSKVDALQTAHAADQEAFEAILAPGPGCDFQMSGIPRARGAQTGSIHRQTDSL